MKTLCMLIVLFVGVCSNASADDNRTWIYVGASDNVSAYVDMTSIETNIKTKIRAYWGKWVFNKLDPTNPLIVVGGEAKHLVAVSCAAGVHSFLSMIVVDNKGNVVGQVNQQEVNWERAGANSVMEAERDLVCSVE